MAKLPLIDFGPYLSANSNFEERQAVALKIDQACRSSGFFYLQNHGIPQELMNGIRDAAREFFETATAEEKATIALKRRDQGGDNARGYLKVSNAEKGSHEAIDFFRPVNPDDPPPFATGQGVNQWPQRPHDFRSVAEAYIDSMNTLGRQLVEALAIGLRVEPQLLLGRVDKAFWNLRVLGYEGRKSRTLSNAGIGEHTDFGILTFLLTDVTQSSLQVLSSSGEWIDADPIEGCFLCNIGDMLSEWTRGAYRSTLHRVVHSSEALRISVPFFFDPNWDAFIEPILALTEGQDNGRHDGVKYSDKFIASVEEPLWRAPMVES